MNEENKTPAENENKRIVGFEENIIEDLDQNDPGNQRIGSSDGGMVVTEDEKIEKAVEKINGIAEEKLFQASIEIGNYIFEEFFHGDPKEVSSKNPNKNVSFKKLCEHKDLKVHPDRLAIMVKVAIQEKFLEEQKIKGVERLTYTHKSFLIRLPDDNNKIEFIQKCIKNNWSTRQLEDQIKKKMKYTSSEIGRYITTTTKFVAIANDIVNIEKNAPQIDETVLSEIPKAKRDNLKRSLTSIKKTLKMELTPEKIDEITKKCDELIEKIEGYKPKKAGRPPKKKK